MISKNNCKKVYQYYDNKKILLAHWDCENKKDNASQNWYSNLKHIFGKIITFSPKKNYFIYGKKLMNQKFLELIYKEKPDVIFFSLIYDEFDPMTFIEIRKKFPKLQMIAFNSDDAWRYEEFYRYYNLFLDYLLTSSHDALHFYKKNNIKNIFLSCGVNLNHFKPFDIEKKYDIIFIGRPGKGRADYLRFLIKNGVKVDIWGDGWDIYPEFKNAYHGVLESEEWPKVVSQSKINLNFSIGGDGKPVFKGRPAEVSACRAFSLVEYCKDYMKMFSKNEIIMFKTKDDLLKKINYYLIHADERERIANAAHNKIVEKYDLEIELCDLFNKLKNKKHNVLPIFSKKVRYLSISDFDDINVKLKDYDYVGFKTKSVLIHSLKDYFQVYSLENSEKDISCCDYYVNSPKLGNYLLFKSRQSFDRIGEKANYFINPAQLMIKKKYFLKHIDSFKRILEGQTINIIKNNAVFVSIPLIEINNFKILGIKEMEDSFQMKFLDKLCSLYVQKNFDLSYLLNLAIKIINGNLFMFSVLKNALRNKSKLNKLREYSSA